MKASARLILAGILGVVLAAPPSYPQNNRDQLINSIATDVIGLRATLKQIQETSDQRNAATTQMMQDILKEMLNRFTAMDASVRHLNESLSQAQTGLAANNEKSNRDLQETQKALDNLKKEFDEGFLAVQNQLRGITRQINDLATAAQPLPSAGQVYSQALADLSSGYYDLAISGFTDFLHTFGADERAAAAAFYIGEAMLYQKKLDEAFLQFGLVLQNYPNSDKRCLALYRQGRILAEQKKTSEAKNALTTVTKECMGTPEAANATTDLKALK